VEAQAAGEQALAVGVLCDVVGADTRRPEIARHTVGPIVQVIGRVGAGDRLAGRPRAGVHPDDLRERHRTQAEGVIVPQIVFDGEGKPGDILERFDAVRLYPFLIQLLAIEGNALINPCHGLLELAQLEFLNLGGRHRLELLIPIHLVALPDFA
jgi:hypothetical protein